MEIGAEIEARPTELDEQGAGVAAVGEACLHVAGALPGETVRAAVEHVSPHARHQAWGRLVRVLQPAAERVAPACPGHGSCGGCLVQHLAYEAQLGWKRGLVERALAASPRLAGVRVEPCVPSPRPLGYRNQAKYVYGTADGRPVLGAFAPRSHRLVDLAGCRVVEPILDEVARALRDLLEAAAVPAFDEQRRTGLLRYVLLRANAAGQVLATLVTSRGPWPEGRDLAEALRARAPAVAGVVHNVNPTAGNVLLGGQDVLLSGADAIEEVVAGVPVRLGPRSFFQLNREVAGLAYAALREAIAGAGPVRRAVDAYAGVGGIAFSIRGQASEVVAIEENPEAAQAGARAARAAGVTGVRFVAATVEDGLAALDEADAIALNPPRAGLAPAVREAVVRLRPRVIAYLSCNPTTLARDLDAICERGFRLLRVVPFDMLPHTAHVESFASLERF
jgi:23S rRNA (uracil1939-C5)-methyltransferase